MMASEFSQPHNAVSTLGEVPGPVELPEGLVLF